MAGEGSLRTVLLEIQRAAGNGSQQVAVGHTSDCRAHQRL